jgi:hypothetical protein
MLHRQSLIIVVALGLVGLPFARAAKLTKGKACVSPIQIFRQTEYGNHQSYLRGDGVATHPHVRVVRQTGLGIRSIFLVLPTPRSGMGTWYCQKNGDYSGQLRD